MREAHQRPTSTPEMWPNTLGFLRSFLFRLRGTESRSAPYDLDGEASSLPLPPSLGFHFRRPSPPLCASSSSESVPTDQ